MKNSYSLFVRRLKPLTRRFAACSALILAVTLFGCKHPAAFSASNHSAGFCIIHNQRLVKAQAFMVDYKRELVESTPLRARLDKLYPNAIPIGHSLFRSKEFPIKDGIIAYCPQCEKALSDAFRRGK